MRKNKINSKKCLICNILLPRPKEITMFCKRHRPTFYRWLNREKEIEMMRKRGEI